MRNGLDDGEEGQLRETWQAVLQHSLVAQSVGAIYGDDSQTGDMQQEVELLQEAIESGDFSAFGEHALSSYDSSGDFWKIILDDDGKVNRVLDDGDKNTLTFVDGEGSIKSINRAIGSLSGQISEIAAGFQTGDDKQSKSDINNIMAFDSGLDWNSEEGWHAIRADAYDYGSGYDPVYAAIKNGNYNEIQKILSNMNQNSQTDISQEMVESALGLNDHSACAITSGAELANNFFQSVYGTSLDSQELIAALGKAQGEMFNDDSLVLSWNGMNAMIAAELEIDNYPVYYNTYDTLEALQADGVKFYLEKFKHMDDSERTHFGSWSNGQFDDPYATVQDIKWWEDPDLNTPEFYGFKTKH
jgi:hypothetical protein